jgi:hypothetical protein
MLTTPAQDTTRWIAGAATAASLDEIVLDA